MPESPDPVLADGEESRYLPRARPARWGAARTLRLVTGVDENALAAVPSERTRYTSLGIAVLTRTAVTSLAVAAAIALAIYGPWWSTVVACLLWGVFSLSFDRWLLHSVSSGSIAASALGLLSRFALSVLLGVVVAEPLLLGMYGAAVDERVAQERQQELTDRAERLRACNPVSGPLSASDLGCGRYRLALPAAPEVGSEYPALVERAIEDDLARFSQRGRTDPVERLRALGHLTDENGLVRGGRAVLLALVIAIDVLPLLAGVSGTTAHDRVLREHIAWHLRADELRRREEQEHRELIGELRQHEARRQKRVETERIEERFRVERANYDERRAELLDALENHLLRTAVGNTNPGFSFGDYARSRPDLEYSDEPTVQIIQDDLSGGHR